MLMLCLVFAAAGPWMPGAGDVSPMDPTIAYGAAPNMLVFAPDGGAGFDAWGGTTCSVRCLRFQREFFWWLIIQPTDYPF